MYDIMKTFRPLRKFSLLRKVLSETIKNEVKKQNRGFLGMLLGTLGASLLVSLLKGKEVKAKILGKGVIRTGEDTVRNGQTF